MLLIPQLVSGLGHLPVCSTDYMVVIAEGADKGGA